MPSWIEFHDSTLEAVCAEPTGVAIRLRAYVHEWKLVAGRWQGSGWSQPVVMRVQGAVSGGAPEAPVELGSGWVRVGSTMHDGIIPLPFASTERATVWLQTAMAEVLELGGTGLDIEATGAAKFIEVLPDDMNPFSD